MTQSVFVPNPRARITSTPTCPHDLPFIRVPKMWGTLFEPPTRDCIECAHACALDEERNDRHFEAWIERLKARTT